MYQFEITDLSEITDYIKNKEKYCIFISHKKKAFFTNKEKAFKFVPVLSEFFTETISVLGSIYQTVQTLGLLIPKNDLSKNSDFNTFNLNSLDFQKNINFLNCRLGHKIDASVIFNKTDNLFYFLLENLKILKSNNINSGKELHNFISRLWERYSLILNNLEEHKNNKSISLI